MKKVFTLIAIAASLNSYSQSTITNNGFESWGGNPAPGVSTEPNNWYSNKSGSGLASSGPQTCYQDLSIKHLGTSSARVETKYYILAVVNGNVTTGLVNAPSANKAEGYISTVHPTNATDIRRMAFTARPDSLVGWYQYTQATSGTNPSNEQGKVRAILHTGHYYDPEVPVNSNHPNLSANKIGDALFLTAKANNTTWKRFSVPFNYASASAPAYIMINITSSADQMTSAPGITGSGSKLWIDDLGVVYNSTGINQNANLSNNVRVFSFDKVIYVDFTERSSDEFALNVYDITGKLIRNEKVEGNKLNSVNLNSENSGLFLYELTGPGYTKTGKLVIE